MHLPSLAAFSPPPLALALPPSPPSDTDPARSAPRLAGQGPASPHAPFPSDNSSADSRAARSPAQLSAWAPTPIPISLPVPFSAVSSLKPCFSQISSSARYPRLRTAALNPAGLDYLPVVGPQQPCASTSRDSDTTPPQSASPSQKTHRSPAGTVAARQPIRFHQHACGHPRANGR